MADNKKERKKQLDDIEKGMDEDAQPLQPEPKATPIPEGAALNPNYQPGNGLPQFMPLAASKDTKGLEEPMVDPVSLAATAATGGLSSVGPALMNAAKNKATSEITTSLLDRIKAAGAMRQQRMQQQGMAPETQPQNIGSSSMYTQGSPVTDYQRQILEAMRQRGKIGQ